MNSLYKKFKKKNLAVARILERDLSLDNKSEEEENFDIIFSQVDEQLSALKTNLNNYSNTNFKESLTFFQDIVDNDDVLLFLMNEMKEQTSDLLNLIIYFLNQHIPQISLNISAIHILNKLLIQCQTIKNDQTRKYEEQLSKDQCLEEEKDYFPISEKILIDLYSIFEYFIMQFFDVFSPDYIPMIFECFQLMNTQFSLAHSFYDVDISKMPNIYQDELKCTIKVINDIISIGDIDPQILQILFKSSTILYTEDFLVYKYFIEAGFVKICFQLMENRNLAFLEITEFLQTISFNDDKAIGSFPENYPEIFRSLLEDEDTPDEFIESILTFIDKLSSSIEFTEKLISIDNFLIDLLNLNKSYNIRIASIKLFYSLTYNHFEVIHDFFKENPDFDIFIDYIDTGYDDVIQIVFSIFGIICQKISQMPEIPDYFYVLAQSSELIDRINDFKDNDESSSQTQECAYLVMTEIKGTIEARNLDIEFNYE